MKNHVRSFFRLTEWRFFFVIRQSLISLPCDIESLISGKLRCSIQKDIHLAGEDGVMQTSRQNRGRPVFLSLKESYQSTDITIPVT